MDVFNWLSPMIQSSITLIEYVTVLLCVGFGIPRFRHCIRFWVLAVVVNVAAFYWMGGQPMKAVWYPYSAAVHNYALKPRAVFPATMVVRVHAAGLNPSDVKLFNYAIVIPFVRWFIPKGGAGFDYAGKVIDTKCPDTFKIGTKVYGQSPLGSAQEYAAVPCMSSGEIPPNVTYIRAAATPTVFLAGLEALKNVGKGDKVLVIGSSGGCGAAGVMIAKAQGASRIYCISSAKNRELSKSYGCDRVFGYDEPGFTSALLDAGEGKLDWVYDTVTSGSDYDYYDVAVRLLNSRSSSSSSGGDEKRYQALGGTALDWMAKFISLMHLGDVQRKHWNLVLPLSGIQKHHFDFMTKHAETLFSNPSFVGFAPNAFDPIQFQKSIAKIESRRMTGKISMVVPMVGLSNKED